MAKNMTRKGLAIGAGFALVGSLFAAVPAQALDPVELNPTDGDSYNVPASAGNFELDAFFSTAAQFAASDNVGFVIVDADGGLDLSNSSVSYAGPTTSTDLEATGSAIRSTSTDSDTGTVTLVTNNNTAGAGAATTLDLKVKTSPAPTESFSVTVQAFIDNNANGEYNAGTDSVSATRTVNFLVDDDITWAVNFTQPSLGDEKLVATVSTTPDLNLDQAGTVKVGFATYDSTGPTYTSVGGSTTVTTGGDFTNGETANSDGEFERTFGGNGVTAATYVAAVVLGSTEVSAEVLRTVAASDAANMTTPVLVAGPNVNGTTNLRTEGTSASVSVTVTDDTSPTQLPVEGEEVTFTFSNDVGDFLNEDGVITAGGESITGDGATSTDTIEVTATTDSDGKATVEFSWSEVEAGADFKVTAKVADVAAGSETFTFVDTAPAALVEHNLLGTGSIWKVEDGSYTIRFAALDNFGQPLVGDNFRVFLTPTDETGEYLTDQQATSLSGGVATFTVDTTSSRDKEIASFEAEIKVASGAGFVSLGTAITETLTVNLGSSNPADEVNVTNYSSPDFKTDGHNISTVEFASANGRLGEVLSEAPAGTAVPLAGFLEDVSGLRTYGAVTLSAPGLLFKVTKEDSISTNRDVYSLGSITVQTNAVGAFGGVTVYSNQSGEQTVTVSSGSASQEIILEFNAPANNAGTTLEIDAPSAVEPGSTLVFDATLTDDFGNLVGGSTTATFNYDGPGFVVSQLTEFTDGEARMTIFLGNNDGGKTGTLTVTVADANNAEDDDLVVQKTVNIGNVPGAATPGEFNAWTKLSDDLTNVKFYAKNPSNQGKIQFFMNGVEIAWHRGTSNTSYEGGALRYSAQMDSYYLVRDRDLVVGSQNVFEIYQDGTRIWRAVKTIN